jgi:17beta-estradiol 17-dehydrogenase / very-long-chain 3-oxoacyl-CoA reductase
MNGFWRHFIRPKKNLYHRYQGGYCVITGATFGLGLEYARQLTKQGFHLVLISRNQTKLNNVRRELAMINSDTDIKAIQFDFDVPYSDENYSELKRQLLELNDVSILVNNVGAVLKKTFFNMSMNEANTLVNVNIIPQVFMTHTLLPKMLERSETEGKRCAILNLSSLASRTRMSNALIYAATKSYNEVISEITQKLLKDKNIDVMTILPGPVLSQMTRYKAPLVITPEIHAKGVLDALGHDKLTFGHYYHYLFMHLCNSRTFNDYYQRKMEKALYE